jgi:hypothetical protein
MTNVNYTAKHIKKLTWIKLKRVYILLEYLSGRMNTGEGEAIPQHTYGGAGGEEVYPLLIHYLGTRWG